MIHFTCPCGKALHAQDAHAGKTTRCPACGGDLAIPDDGAVQTADAARAPGSSPSEGVRRSRRERDGMEEGERTQAPKTSGMAIASVVLGLLSLGCSLLAGLPAIVFGVIALVDIGRSQGRKKGKGLAIAGIAAGLIGLILVPVLLFFAVGMVREAAGRMQSANNLKQMALAMHGYHDAYGKLPSAAVCDPGGKPLLSWRVTILPYVEQSGLYGQFKLDEPWDGPNNSKLIPMMPKIYAQPGDATAQPGQTYYRVFVSKDAGRRPNPAFDWCKGLALANGFPDGTQNTILVAESATAVPWTKPDEMVYDPDGPLPALGGHFARGFNVIMADGAVHFVLQGTSEPTLRAAITRNGGDALGPDW